MNYCELLKSCYKDPKIISSYQKHVNTKLDVYRIQSPVKLFLQKASY